MFFYISHSHSLTHEGNKKKFYCFFFSLGKHKHALAMHKISAYEATIFEATYSVGV